MAKSISDAELAKQIDQWNPMKEAYSNVKMNQYDSGPGANLAPELHVSNPQNKQQQSTSINIPFLIFSNVPSNMKSDGMRSLCDHYASPTNVRFNKTFNKFFIDFKTVSDMEAVFRGLEKNEYGFKVMIGKSLGKKTEPNISLGSNSASTYVPMPPRNGPDYENRNYALSAKQNPRPHFPLKPIVSAADYEKPGSLLKKNDPKRRYYVEYDAHAHETPNFKLGINSYAKGRTFIEAPEHIKSTFMKDNGSKERYLHVEGNARRPIKLMNCTLCGLEGDLCCERCATPYCSNECSTKAWPEHRLVCTRIAIDREQNRTVTVVASKLDAVVEKPTVNGIADVAKTPTKYRELAKNGGTVVVVSICKANVLFVRTKNPEADVNYFRIISTVQADGPKLPKLETLQPCGTTVVVLSEGQYHRAMVLSNDDPQKIRLIYMDYGSIYEKPLNELYEAPDSYALFPHMVIPVLLKGVDDVYITTGLRAFLYSKLENVIFKVQYDEVEDFTPQKSAYSVELIDTVTNQNFNELIATLCRPVVKNSADAKCFEHSPAMKSMPLPTGKNIELVVMDNSLLAAGTLYCSTQSYAQEIEKFQKDIHSYGESQKDAEAYAPTFMELCIVKFDVDGKWYRGVGLETVGDGYPTIQFLDYGNTAAVPIKNIRRYPEQFLIPKFTSSCEIADLPETIEKVLLARLEKLLPIGGTLFCDEVTLKTDDEGKEYYELKISEIMKKLRDECLLFDPTTETD